MIAIAHERTERSNSYSGLEWCRQCEVFLCLFGCDFWFVDSVQQAHAGNYLRTERYEHSEVHGRRSYLSGLIRGRHPAHCPNTMIWLDLCWAFTGKTAACGRAGL